ncbi:MAG: nucleotidyltransferase domain-containing protein [Methanomicrobiaceae archaeon]|nr:nucleotidyltransferase domain-containing protein [Methanomicrobiaceae archaeon]
MLTRLFSSKVRVKLLELFLLHPDEEWFVREITRKTGENINAIRRELSNLEELGLLESRPRGNQKYYSVRTDFPLFDELARIMVKTRGIADVLREFLDDVPGIARMFLYGSFAEGTFGRESDIDLFVIGEVDEASLIDAVRAAEKRLGREVNYVVFTPGEFRQRLDANDPFITHVVGGKTIDLELGQ